MYDVDFFRWQCRQIILSLPVGLDPSNLGLLMVCFLNLLMTAELPI